jgi:acyl CoA:acetate/3-ketoacid CoA transferase alpha subunit
VQVLGMRCEQIDADASREFVRKGGVLVFVGGFSEQITTAIIREMIEHDREDRISDKSES